MFSESFSYPDPQCQIAVTLNNQTEQHPSSAALASVHGLDSARSRSVRLVISIPVLSLLIVLGSGVLLYLYLMNLAETQGLEQGTALLLERAALTILLISIAISLLSGVVGYILARQIVSPIRQMVETMELIAEGDLTTKLEPIQLGEFGLLGNTFNRMVEQLNQLFQERDRQLHESFVGAHIQLNRDGVVLQADHKVRKIFGLSPGEMLGKNVLTEKSEFSIIRENPKLRTCFKNVVESTLKGNPASLTVAVRSKKSVLPNRLLISSIRLESDVEQGSSVLMEIRDIAGIANFYDQIQRADRLAAIGTLSTGIAHEVRNPLASIRGMVQLMSEFNEKEADREYLDRITREVDRVDNLLKSIMDFANIADTPAEVTDLNHMIEDVLESARMSIGDGADSVEVELNLDAAVPAATLRRDRIRQALLNLAVNAFQHCVQNKTGPFQVSTNYQEVDIERPVTIVFSNPGHPIEDTDAERLFEPFFTTKDNGTGLGLPIAHQIIQANGGLLEFSNDNESFTFIIRLPLDLGREESASQILRKAHVRLDESREGHGEEQ